MSPAFPEPTTPARSRAEVFLRYLDYFRSQLVRKLEGLPDDELRRSRLPSGWTPLELLKHLRYGELRCTPRPSAAGPSSSLTILLTSADRASGGTGPTPDARADPVPLAPGVRPPPRSPRHRLRARRRPDGRVATEQRIRYPMRGLGTALDQRPRIGSKGAAGCRW